MRITSNDQSDNDLLSLRQAAQILGVNRMWLSGWLARDGIKLQRLGKSLGIRRRDLKRVPAPQQQQQEA